MQNKQLKIYKDEQWVDLDLLDKTPLRYNKVINKIKDFNNRNLSHTNTFPLELTFKNRQSLDINIFNVQKLALRLNVKYQAKYFINNTLVQKGFLVINNIINDNVNLNFIDEPLGIFETWGSISYIDFLQSQVLPFPSDYQTAIDEANSYTMDKDNVLSHLSNVGTRGYPLALFPNNLNTLGDKFQLDDDGVRVDDRFNAYQSRPIFNAKAFLDLITETYGYTPIYDDSIDWGEFESTYIISPNANNGLAADGAIDSEERSFESSIGPFYTDVQPEQNRTNYVNCFIFDSSVSLKPNDINYWSSPSGVQSGYQNRNCVYVPLSTGGNVGTITITSTSDFTSSSIQSVYSLYVGGCWEHTTAGGLVRHAEFSVSGNFTGGSPRDTNGDYSFDIDKADIDTIKPSLAGDFIGIIIIVQANKDMGSGASLADMSISESFLTSDEVSFDEYSQYLPTSVNLTYAAPKETIKKLLSNLLHWRSILININEKDKEITFFSYAFYAEQRDVGNYYNWSEYHQKHSLASYNTQYGNKYAKKNRLSLTNPYSTNYHDIKLKSQGDESRLKDFAENKVAIFKDIETVFKIGNTNTDYFEYTSKGLGLVKKDGVVGNLTQSRADGNEQGIISNLPAITNVDQSTPADSNEAWYKLIDTSIRIPAPFLLPIDVFKSVDLTYPVFVNDLNGFYIIEEIEEYTDESTEVVVKLIKLPSTF